MRSTHASLSLFAIAAALVCCAAVIAPRATAADRIVLRNLTIISDKRVASMTLDGVTLDDGARLSWDEIETGKLDGQRQALFDKYLANIGIHLYRIRQRLAVGDYRSLLPHAEAIARFYQDRDSDTAYVVMQSLMWGRMANGQREAAVAPYWRCFELLRARQGKPPALPGERRLKYDPSTGVCLELPPIWFDRDAAQAAMSSVAAAIGQVQEPRPDATRVYYAALALAAGDVEAAERAAAGVGDANRTLAQLRDIVLAQREVEAGAPGAKLQWLQTSLDKLDEANRPLALYWLGRSQAASDDAQVQQQGLLNLLRLPAAYAEQQPDLAAAGLFAAMNSLEARGELPASIAVRGELLSKYAQSWHAAKAAPSRSD
ncbi:MAG: hypothetical protein KDA41_00180 [Planctomycetales bacterium]|nr:hypothetical protein [Planctomycetales bacterium]